LKKIHDKYQWRGYSDDVKSAKATRFLKADLAENAHGAHFFFAGSSDNIESALQSHSINVRHKRDKHLTNETDCCYYGERKSALERTKERRK
jgi:hypothetical protein